MIRKVDKKNKFVSVFNSKTGFYARTGIIENGIDTGIDSFQASFPELLDIGIMGHCSSCKECAESGIQCYQQASKFNNRPNMTLDNYKRIIDEISGKAFQVALGGAGNPDDHEQFEEIVKYSRENNVVPNYTTSGINMTLERAKITKNWCGACAVSFHNKDYTYSAINTLLEAGVKTNIHYVLSNNSISEAIRRLKENDFPKGINAIIFLMHKAVGAGKVTNNLKEQDSHITEFFNIVDNNTFDYKIGFDSCTVGLLINKTTNVNMDSLDYCEGSRYSMYITPDMLALPCSFDQSKNYAVDLTQYSIQEAWDSTQFEKFRDSLRFSCSTCKERLVCGGGCPMMDLTHCNKKEKDRYYKEAI